MLSAEEFKRQFEESRVLKEIFADLQEWIPQIQGMLEDSDNTFTASDYDQFRGSLKAIRNVLNIPTVIYERKKIDASNGEGDNQ